MTHTAGIEPRQLRPYQIEAVSEVESRWFAESPIRRTGVVLPTGAGKSTVIAKLAVNSYRRGDPVVMIAHRAELIQQMTDTIFEVDPTIPRSDVGIVQAEQDDHSAPIVGATLQTLRNARRLKSLGKRKVILWDEVHHAAAEGFHTTFEDLGGYEDALMCGFTATMRRADRGRIGLGDVIEEIAYTKDLKWAIDNGFLVRPKGLTVRLDDLNALNEVRTVAGDFAQGEMQAVMEAASQFVVDAIKMHAKDRRPIIFAASVEAAHTIGEQLRENLYPTVVVTGEQAYPARQQAYADFRDGTAQAMVTVMVLTEGADFPMCDCVVLARPTRSSNLYSQMVGRALRTHPDKDDALVLDLSGSARNMRLTSLPQILPGVTTRVVGAEGDEIIEESEPEEVNEIFRAPRNRRRGPVEMVSIDIVTGRTREVLWLETIKGVPFVSLTDGWCVFLWPEGGRKQGAQRWAVGNINTRTRQGGWMGQEEKYLRLDEAVEYAERAIPEAGFDLPQRNAGWHSGNKAPSEAQLRLARTLGIVEYEDMTKGRLSDEISIVFASRVLDAAVKQNETVTIPGRNNVEGVSL